MLATETFFYIITASFALKIHENAESVDVEAWIIVFYQISTRQIFVDPVRYIQFLKYLIWLKRECTAMFVSFLTFMY
jgi:hypothetical protein